MPNGNSAPTGRGAAVVPKHDMGQLARKLQSKARTDASSTVAEALVPRARVMAIINMAVLPKRLLPIGEQQMHE